jgi:hypothetical protein
MRGWKVIWELGLGLLVVWMLAGCSDVLLEAKRKDGGVERIRVDSDSCTDYYEDKLRFFNKSKKEQNDDLSIILKKESTF